MTITAQYTKISNPTFVVENKNAHAGDTVEIAINIQNNPGILGMALNVYYDENAMSLTNVTNGSAVADVLTLSKPAKRPYKSGSLFNYDGQEVLAEQIKDGDVLVMTFTISESAKNGTYPITITDQNGDTINNDLESVSVDIMNGGITIS